MNSATVNVTVSRTSAARVNIVIHNAAGQKIYSNELQQSAGTQVQQLDLHKLAASHGIYIVSVYIDNKKVKTKPVLRP